VKKTAEPTATPVKTKASASKPVTVAAKKTPVVTAPKATDKPAATPAKATKTVKAVAAPAPAPAKAAAPVAAAAKKPVAAKPQATKPAVTPPAAVAKAAPAPAPVAPVVVVSPAAVAVAPPGRRGGRKAAAAAVPTPQPKPSQSPDAAKATFSNLPERVMTPLVHSPARKDPKLANNWKSKTVDQLTDEEVLSMPDAEYMNDTQLAFFRHKLVRLKQDILANAGQTTENLREDTVVVPDPADRATIEEEHALELRTRDRERKLLKKIEQSIARIDSGDYGYCDETGEAIGVGRLIARPTANLSLEAQQRRELKQKMFGD
jgi:DnaK suppressor protein